MTPEAQRIAIAEACGWVLRPAIRGSYWFHPRQAPTFGELPSFTSDLNAMHEAEKGLTEEQHYQYCYLLHDNSRRAGGVTVNDWNRVGISATAAQRAEAFLRTIGKWENSK